MARKNSKGGLKRKNDRFPGLNRQLHPRSRQEYLDYDYISQLSDEEKEILSKFTDEYYGATLAHKDDWHGRRKDFHRLKKDRKACRDRNNARLRDVLIVARTTSTADNIEEKIIELTEGKTYNPADHEDRVIELLDIKLAEELAAELSKLEND